MPPYPFDDPALGRVAERTGDGGRLGRDDAVALFATRDLWGLARLANRERERHHGDRTFYTVSRHLNYSNLCVNRCRFCAFRRDRGQDDAWEYSVAEALERLRAKTPQDVAELHVVGGLHPDRPLEFYLNLLDELRRQYPEAQIKAFTAPEIAHIARRAGLSVAETLQRLISVGLDCLPGGGAEIFAPQVRRRICPEKITGAEWLDVHRTAHRAGLKTNASMLYGHIESPADRVDHLLALRDLQDETGGFQAFIPLAYHPPPHERAPAPHRVGGATDLKVMAVARLVLDNIPHLKAYWVNLGLKIAQIAQSFGADDLDGTVVEETIHHMAGASSPGALAADDLERLIRETGRTPVRRNALYEEQGHP